MLITKHTKIVLNCGFEDALSVRVGDLIALLIIAKGGQCKDVYVPENVQMAP